MKRIPFFKTVFLLLVFGAVVLLKIGVNFAEASALKPVLHEESLLAIDGQYIAVFNENSSFHALSGSMVIVSRDLKMRFARFSTAITMPDRDLRPF